METSSKPPVLTDAASTSSSFSSVTIATIIIASAVIITAAVYFLLLSLCKRFRRTFSTFDDVVRYPNPRQRHADLLDSLPLFTFRSVTRHLNGGDCAVCLSKFEPNHQLRLLPLCCHAFHAACIDTWIVSNQTCPLCRSIVRASDCAALDKILSDESRNNFSNGNGNGGSFRVELGSISRRRGSAAEGARRTYSLGSLEYIVDDCVHEVFAGSTTHRRGISEIKDSSIVIPEAEAQAQAAERNWLREYLATISSRTMSFRSSNSRYFSGSSRRSEAAVVPEDLELNRAGEEISEVFRWISQI